MRKYLALNYRRRPSLDSLESRYLLSSGIVVIEVHRAGLHYWCRFATDTASGQWFWKPVDLVGFKRPRGLAGARVPSRFLSHE